MLLLLETPVGFGVFKVLDESKLNEVGNLFKEFETLEKANKIVQLEDFMKFKNVSEGLASTTALAESSVGKKLKKLLKKVVVKDKNLCVADPKLGAAIKEKFDIKCKSSPAIKELMRCIRMHMDSLFNIDEMLDPENMCLGIGHSYSRYVMKFSSDKIDSMIVHAIGIFQDLDKDLNNMVMRCKEFYGWHYPELVKSVPDNLAFIKLVHKMGMRSNAATMDWSEIDFLDEATIQRVKDEAETSMGVDITEDDIANIQFLCREIIEGYEFRNTLSEYIANRMLAIAPNLTALVGELIGAKLISHAGSLLSLAKQAGSTVQLLGAEKALFRALKTKHSTPKYGLIYHASIIAASTPKNKGKMARKLAAKTALASRADAFGDETSSVQLGAEHKAYLQSQLQLIESQMVNRISGLSKSKAKFEKHTFKKEVKEYKSGIDSTAGPSSKRKREDGETESDGSSKLQQKVKSLFEAQEQQQPKKKKKLIEEIKQEPSEEAEEQPEKKKKKKRHSEEATLEVKEKKTQEVAEEESPKKKKKKKRKSEETEE